MKKVLLALALVAASSASAAESKKLFDGSNTLAGAISKALTRSGYGEFLEYQGTGSGNGEKGLVNGDWGLAPMSREMKADVAQQLAQKGYTVSANVLGLDGLSVFVKADHPLQALTLPQIVDIYTCSVTKWEQIPGSGRTGAINALRRDDASGTTDAFKHFTGLKTFGACVKDVSSTDNVADITARDPQAIGYSGRSAERFDSAGARSNRALAIAKVAGGPAILPTDANIRSFAYPMARKLYVYSVAQLLTPRENEFLAFITDRSNMDPIMTEEDFISED